jgi:hypothetical protein
MLVVEKVKSQRNPKEIYLVKVSTDGNIFFCSCKDFQYRQRQMGQPCKHLKQVMERLEKGIKIIIPKPNLILRHAIQWFVKKYKAEIVTDYRDLKNINFIGKQVGTVVNIRGSRFLVTFRPKGLSYKEDGEFFTAFNISEIYFQKQYNMDRIVIFAFDNGLKTYRFNINKVWEYLATSPKLKLQFKSGFPDESEPILNIPISLAEDFDMWLGERK